MPLATDTIVACCTAQGPGAIALLRVSGPDAFIIADRIARIPGKTLSTTPSHTVSYGYIEDDGRLIDDVLFLAMHAPRTFTGENTVEITCHNNQFIIADIVAAACKHGARQARPGEFTQQAVINNKIDVLQAEAINELIHAQTQQALRASREQLQGSLSAELASLDKQLIHALALAEASFEFIDEEHLQFGQQIKDILTQVCSTIEQLLSRQNTQQLIKEGARVALIGSVNAGKSSLFNALVGSNRAIVAPTAGTTRDVVEQLCTFETMFVTFADTAGLRQTADVIEQEGIKRSYEEAAKADLVLLVIDSSRMLTDDEAGIYQDLLHRYHDKTIVIQSKVDQQQPHMPTWADTAFAVSMANASTIASLRLLIKEQLDSQMAACASPYLLNKRHTGALQELLQGLRALATTMNGGFDYELIALDLKTLIAQLSELTGKSVAERGMDAIFITFCVGK